MERYFLAGSTIFYLWGFAYSLVLLRVGKFRPGRLNLCAVVGGFTLQTGFLVVRGYLLGHFPVSGAFETLVFLSWSIALASLVVGRIYRLSLLGLFAAPLVIGLQLVAWFRFAGLETVQLGPLVGEGELPMAMVLLAYGVLVVVVVAGVMYLVQERQLKMRVPGLIFHLLPPITNLSEAMQRLLGFGVGLLTLGIWQGSLPMSRSGMGDLLPLYLSG